MNTLIAGAIVTETHTPSTVEDWMIDLFFGGLIGLFIAFLVLTFFGNDPSRKQLFAFGIIASPGLVVAGVGGIAFVLNTDHTESETHYSALTAAMKDTYDLEAIEYTDSEGIRVLSTGERVPDTDVLCEPVNTNSPEYTGITDGQQISFKVGIPDCRAENPDVQIVVTKTPGIPLTADQLRK